jgi:hypothetical protein
MINEVRNLTLAVLNKENNGYLTPDEFNLFAEAAQKEKFQEYMYDYATATQKVNARMFGTGNADVLGRLEEVLDKFTPPNPTLPFAGGVFALPTDYFRINHLLYGGRKIDYIPHNKIVELLNSNQTAPSVLFPAYTISGSSATVYPTTIQSGVTANYVRYPAIPKWTYTTVGDAPLFNPGANDYQDFELPESDKFDLAVRILQLAGVSIREQEVVQAAKAEELQEKQEQ